jgi:hypothetical protein
VPLPLSPGWSGGTPSGVYAIKINEKKRTQMQHPRLIVIRSGSIKYFKESAARYCKQGGTRSR